MRGAWHAYLAANVPGWILAGLVAWIGVRAFELPPWVAAALVSAWIGKDLLLYPVMRRFYFSDPPERRIVGERGVALNALAPRGTVRVRGEIWNARVERGADAIAEGTAIRVRDVDGMLLTVTPDPPSRT